jgi:hypothetical protein
MTHSAIIKGLTRALSSQRTFYEGLIYDAKYGPKLECRSSASSLRFLALKLYTIFKASLRVSHSQIYLWWPGLWRATQVMGRAVRSLYRLLFPEVYAFSFGTASLRLRSSLTRGYTFISHPPPPGSLRRCLQLCQIF